MNIEEAIKILKEPPDFSLRYYERENAIDVLLTAYEKEKGENIKLRFQEIPLIEGKLKAYKDRVNELKAELEKEKEKNKELNWKYTASWVDEHFISKDQIKAKIEKLENEHTGCTHNVFSVLQSLLEEKE